MIKHTVDFAIQKNGNLIKQIGKCSIYLPKTNNNVQKTDKENKKENKYKIQ